MNVIGIDLGGTNIAAAKIDESGELIEERCVPTEAAEGGNHVMSNMTAAAARLQDDATAAVGVCSPGVIDHIEGISRGEATNIPGWNGMRIAEHFRRKLGLRCYCDNDANAAAAGEAWLGAGVDDKIVLVVTLGTGVGGGIVIKDRVFHGTNNLVAEFGHMSVELDGRECGCGNRGCVERYASAGALAHDAREAVKAAPKRGETLLEAAGGAVEKIDARIVCDAARNGDELAAELLDTAARYLSVAVGNLINIFNPGVVILSGGMSLAGDELTGRVRRELATGRAYAPILQACRVVSGKLGNKAGVFGAARVALNRLADLHR